MALTLFRRAQQAHPDIFWVNADLGRELLRAGQPEAAVRYYSVALGVRPQSRLALRNLATALHQSGQLGEAAETFRRLIDLQPHDAQAHAALGAVLLQLGEGQDAAIEFREAKRLRPDDWTVCNHVARAWLDWGDWGAALTELREAVRRRPSRPVTHNALGQTLLDAGRTAEAIAAFREAIRLDSRFATAHVNLGRTLLARGELAVAREAVGRGDRGLPSWEGKPARAALVRDIEKMMALDSRLPAFLRGQDRPADAGEAVGLAQLCFSRRLTATSARLWSEVWATRPELVDDLGADSRYQAARAWALAGCGWGEDSALSDAAARKRWRAQALDWVQQEFAACASLLHKGPLRERAEIPQRLGRWQVDPAWAGLRDEAGLALLPDAERRVFRDLWSRVQDLQEQARGRGLSSTPAPPS
jgi:serine/threonine-protein kinase